MIELRNYMVLCGLSNFGLIPARGTILELTLVFLLIRGFCGVWGWVHVWKFITNE